MKDLQLIYRLNKDWSSQTTKVVKAGGQTNRNFIVTCKGKKFFVRLPWERNDVVNRTIEGKNILVLSKNKKLQGILPKYYMYILNRKNILDIKSREQFELPDGTMMTEYILSREFSFRDFCQPVFQKALAQLFFTFHNSGLHFYNSYNVFQDEIEKYRKKAMKLPLQKFLSRQSISQLFAFGREAEKNLQNLKNGTATHNDFIFQNFLVAKDKKIYLLDFEYAGQNKKGGIFYDFGFLFADNLFRRPTMTRTVFEEFLLVADKVYKKKLDRKQIYWSAIAVVVMQIWWGILRYFAVPLKERPYFKDYVTQRIQGITKLVKNITRKES